MFDEPAANLHARAQGELLESFEKIIEGGNKIIYSTHSHHMVNPKWLSGAYIVENAAIDYDEGDDTFNLAGRQTKISAISYRTFVSRFPDRVSYYQPVVERLGYINPKVVPSKPVVITEGVSDYYVFLAVCGGELAAARFEFVPGLGAGASGPLIAFLLALGKKFLVLLDDDKAGRREALNYREKWFLTSDVVCTLSEINSQLEGKNLEGLLSEATHALICRHFDKRGTKASKKEIGAFFAEKCFEHKEGRICSAETEKIFRGIVASLNGRFD